MLPGGILEMRNKFDDLGRRVEYDIRLQNHEHERKMHCTKR